MEEKRSYMRIPTRLGGHLRVLPDPDDIPLFHETAYLGGTGVPPYDSRESGMSESLYALLCSINAKLDMLLSMQGRDGIEKDFPVSLHITEISGAGIRFSSTVSLEPDRHAEVVLILSRFPLRMAGAIGQIVRQEPTEDGTIIYSIDFTRIRDRDLENIVQFVFQSQRDSLRGEKWG